jgi:hypothetical protein
MRLYQPAIPKGTSENEVRLGYKSIAGMESLEDWNQFGSVGLGNYYI